MSAGFASNPYSRTKWTDSTVFQSEIVIEAERGVGRAARGRGDASMDSDDPIIYGSCAYGAAA